MTKHVNFTQIKDGTKDEYLFLRAQEDPFVARTQARLLAELERQEHDTLEGYKITRLEHALQCATRALRDEADDEWVVAALLHDIADGLAPRNHDRAAAEILRPYVRDECAGRLNIMVSSRPTITGTIMGGIVMRATNFQPPPHYHACVDFCERWDQTSFDDGYRSEPLAIFVPLLEKVFAKPIYSVE